MWKPIINVINNICAGYGDYFLMLLVYVLSSFCISVVMFVQQAMGDLLDF